MSLAIWPCCCAWTSRTTPSWCCPPSCSKCHNFASSWPRTMPSSVRSSMQSCVFHLFYVNLIYFRCRVRPGNDCVRFVGAGRFATQSIDSRELRLAEKRSRHLPHRVVRTEEGGMGRLDHLSPVNTDSYILNLLQTQTWRGIRPCQAKSVAPIWYICTRYLHSFKNRILNQHTCDTLSLCKFNNSLKHIKSTDWKRRSNDDTSSHKHTNTFICRSHLYSNWREDTRNVVRK